MEAEVAVMTGVVTFVGATVEAGAKTTVAISAGTPAFYSVTVATAALFTTALVIWNIENLHAFRLFHMASFTLSLYGLDLGYKLGVHEY